VNKDGTITINIFDLLKDLDDEAIDRLSREIACHDLIIESVSEQILGTCDSRQYEGTTRATDEHPTTPLQQARRRVAKGANDAAAIEIERLEFALRQKNELIAGLRKLVQDMRDLGAEEHFWSAYDAHARA
jgi:hypothetical protein